LNTKDGTPCAVVEVNGTYGVETSSAAAVATRWSSVADSVRAASSTTEPVRRTFVEGVAIATSDPPSTRVWLDPVPPSADDDDAEEPVAFTVQWETGERCTVTVRPSRGQWQRVDGCAPRVEPRVDAAFDAEAPIGPFTLGVIVGGGGGFSTVGEPRAAGGCFGFSPRDHELRAPGEIDRGPGGLCGAKGFAPGVAWDLEGIGVFGAEDPIGPSGSHGVAEVWFERDLAGCASPPGFPRHAARSWRLPRDERVRSVFSSSTSSFVLLTRPTADCCSVRRPDVIRAYAFEAGLAQPEVVLETAEVPSR